MPHALQGLGCWTCLVARSVWHLCLTSASLRSIPGRLWVHRPRVNVCQCQDESFSMHWHAMTLILQQFVRMLILFKDIWQFKAILTAWCSDSSVTEALPSRPQSFVENNFVGPVWSFQQKVFLVSLWPHDCSNFQSLGWNSVSFFKSMLMHPD